MATATVAMAMATAAIGVAETVVVADNLATVGIQALGTARLPATALKRTVAVGQVAADANPAWVLALVVVVPPVPLRLAVVDLVRTATVA